MTDPEEREYQAAHARLKEWRKSEWARIFSGIPKATGPKPRAPGSKPEVLQASGNHRKEKIL